MSVTLRKERVEELIRLALNGRDCRDVIIDIIDEAFADDVVRFFQEMVIVKFGTESITFDWYRERFLDKEMDNVEFTESLESLLDEDVGIDLSLTWRGVSVDLDLNETMVAINALAVRRAGIRGGAWSEVSRRVEVPLMETLCRMFEVDPRFYTDSSRDDDSVREVDFYLLPPDGGRARCEVKLLAAGNTEGGDSQIARGGRVFVAIALSEQNQTVCDNDDTMWTQLQPPNGFLRFQNTLSALGIPHTRLDENENHADRIERAIRATFDA